MDIAIILKYFMLLFRKYSQEYHRVHKFLMLVVVSGVLRLTSSFIQGRVYWDTDAPNMTPCRTWCIGSTDTDPGWSPTLFEGVCNFNVQSGLLSDQHRTTSFTWLSNHGVIRVKCLTQEHNTNWNYLASVGFELSILWSGDCQSEPLTTVPRAYIYDWKCK